MQFSPKIRNRNYLSNLVYIQIYLHINIENKNAKTKVLSGYGFNEVPFIEIVLSGDKH